MPRLVLMTGAGGFVGAHLRRRLFSDHPGTTVVGTGLGGEAACDIALDLTDAAAVDAVVARVRPDALVHLAAQASVGAAETGAAARTFAVNLGGTLNLALAVARHVPTATVLFASSSEVYGHAFGAEPIDETVAPRPANGYARSKLLAEEVLAAVLPATARLIVARPFNHTGPGQRGAFVLPSFAEQIARIEAGLQPPLLRVGNLEAQRDFLDVRDVVAAYVALLAAASTLPDRFTCNIATGTARPLQELLDILRRLARVSFSVEVDPARLRPSDTPYAAGHAERLSAATGWSPRIPLDAMLADLLEDARERVGRRNVAAP